MRELAISLPEYPFFSHTRQKNSHSFPKPTVKATKGDGTSTPGEGLVYDGANTCAFAPNCQEHIGGQILPVRAILLLEPRIPPGRFASITRLNRLPFPVNVMSDHPQLKLAVLLGTNASGKSELGIRLASHFGGEIISADSRQVYRGLDLGSGKITPEQARIVPHHLIDVAEVTDYYSLAQYQQAAYRAIDSIAEAGRMPFLVGGTGLYVSAIVEGYELVDVPPNKPLRAELDNLPLDQLVERLKKADPEAAGHIDQNNPRRIIRAIEIASAGHTHAAGRQRSPRYDCLQLGLSWPREALEQRIEKRLQDRLAGGMIDEVAGLRRHGVPDLRLEKLGLEYRYITRYLRGEISSLDELRRQLGIAIRQFAKDQLTWFKRDRRIIWLDTARDYFQETCDRIRDWRGLADIDRTGANRAFIARRPQATE
jgi:tRNA dimethylallyltransferase